MSERYKKICLFLSIQAVLLVGFFLIFFAGVTVLVVGQAWYAKQAEVEQLTVLLQSLQNDCRDIKNENAQLHNMVDKLASKKQPWKVSEAVVTAYSPLDDRNGINSQGDPTKTASGMKVGPGRFAVDPKRIPYGSEILILYKDGAVEHGIAADTGGAMRKADHIVIDVFRHSFDQAMDFGTKDSIVLWRAPSQ